MKYLLAIALNLAFIASFSQSNKQNPLLIGESTVINSRILNESRQIWISLPRGYDRSKPHKYPVIYLLDAESHFHSLTGLVQQLSEVNGNKIIPPSIVVGITNTDRNRDLTPTHISTDPAGKPVPHFKSSGGGELFTLFIQKELIPYIDSAYRTGPHRTLIGHSFGGLLAVNTLLKHSALFSAYLLIDPSMWWDSGKLLSETSGYLQKEEVKDKDVYLAIANTMAPGMDTARVKIDSGESTTHVRSILKLVHKLQGSSPGKIRFSYKYYPEESHSTLPLQAEMDGLRKLFGFYSPIFVDSLYDTKLKVNAESAILAISKTSQ